MNAGRFQQERRLGLAEAAHLVGLVVVDGETVALAVAHALHVLPAHHDPASRRHIGSGDHLEQRGLAGAVRPHDADNLRFLECMVDLELKGGGAVEQAAPIDLGDAIEGEQRSGCHASPPSSRRLRPGSAVSAAASPAQAT